MKLRLFLKEYKIILIFLGCFAVLSIINPFFFSNYNINTLFLQMPAYGMAAIGLTILLISGYLDISMGSIIAFSGVLFAVFLRISGSLIVSILITFAASACVGLINGLCVAKLKLDSFVVSLCAMIYVRGIALSISKQKPVLLISPEYSRINEISFGPVPLLFVFLLIAAVSAEYFLKKTGFGRNIYAIGGNRTIAKMAGINIPKHTIIIFILYGLLSGIGGLILVSRMNSGTPVVGVDAPLTIIPMLILGGTSLSGGKGGAVKTLFGIAFLSMVFNAMSLYNVPANLQELVKGTILLTIIVVEKVYENKDVKV